MNFLPRLVVSEDGCVTGMGIAFRYNQNHQQTDLNSANASSLTGALLAFSLILRHRLALFDSYSSTLFRVELHVLP
ncbi:hypothetical protein EYC80_009595 [Monilinia laxa]|uniref:Uncharacterized protein n=1 Tax=Monilinia laxa TaxID=61186 RepID=A0A5N6JYB3_MONLA|nr:hypothetical protein EYC80_009595 [Monilinia laxa]